MRPALGNEYQNPGWNRTIANRWSGVAGILAATVLGAVAVVTRQLDVGARLGLLGVLAVGLAFGVREVHRRYQHVKVWTEGSDLVIRNAFSERRLPVADVRRGVWHTNRSGGMPLSAIKVRIGGHVDEIRVLALPPAEARSYVEGLTPEGKVW